MPTQTTSDAREAATIEPTASSGREDRAREPEGPSLGRGAVIGRYLVIETLGVGGMGEVFSAYDPQLDRRVALKLVHVEPRHDAAEARDRLLREAQALARLSHPNVVTVYDTGTHGDRVFIAMEYVKGQTMSEWLRAVEDDDFTRERWRDALSLMVQAGRGLAAAHAAGLVHRDFTPANIMVSDDGRVRVLDFGLARRFDDATDRDPVMEQCRLDSHYDSSCSLSLPLTQTGVVMGTPTTMAPEQFFNGTIDERTDQFSFCVVLYRALFGRRPFAGETFQQLGRAVARGELRDPPKSSRIPGAIVTALRRGLSVSRSDRYPNMDALLEVLERGRRPWRRPARWLAVTAITAAGGGGLVALEAGGTSSPAPCSGAADRLSGVWDEPHRQRLTRAFEATELPYASDARAVAVRVLDRYAERWAQLRTQICEATRVHAEQSEVLMDQRMSCLDARLRDLNAMTAVLTAADAEVVSHAAQGVWQLPPLEDCATLERDDSGRQVPDDPELAARVETLRRDLADATAQMLAGRYDASLNTARDALARARGTEYRPLIAEAALVVGKTHERKMAAAPARAAYREALYAAASSGHDRAEAESLLGLLSIVGTHDDDVETALHYADHAGAVIERLGRPPRVSALEALYRGNALMSANAFEPAVEQFDRARALAREAEGAEPILLASLNNIAAVKGRQGHYREAAEAFEHATRNAREQLGPWHPMVGSHHNNLGVTYSRLEEHDAALEHMRKALEIFDRSLGREHPEIGRAYHNLGVVQGARGNPQASYDSYLRALDIKTRSLGPRHNSVAMSANNVGDALIQLGRPAQAIPYLEQALRIWTEPSGDGGANDIYALSSLAEAQLALGRIDPATSAVRQALQRSEGSGIDPIELAKTRFIAARTLWHIETSRPEALALARRARTDYAQSDRPSRRELAAVDAWLRERE